MAWIVGELRSARIEDCVGRGGCHDRSLNVASVTGPAMFLILKDLVQTPRSWIGIQQWNLILISKCHKCHSFIFQIRPISRVPILIAQWYPIDLSIPYLASVHHDHEVSRFITVPLTTLSSLDNPEFIGYVCQLMKNAWSTVIESDIRGVQWRHHTYTSRSTVSSDEDEVKISAKMRHTYEGGDVVSLWMS